MRLTRVGTLFFVAFLATLPAAFVAPSQVVINEIMQNPQFAGDTEGEWVELYNAGDSGVDLDGWTIRDNGSNSHIIDAENPLVIAPNGYVVLGRNADSLINGNVPVSYAYGSDITLGNGSDQIIVEDADGIEQDRVEYDDGLTFPDPDGASMELIHPAVDNSHGESWKESETSWEGNDKGTPGFDNSVLDETPPTILSVLASVPTLVEVLFSEAVDPGSSQSPENYLILPDIGIPTEAARDSANPGLIRLTVNPLAPGVPYAITVRDVTDLAGNTMAPSVQPFSLGEPVAEGDIVVTEIMKDPSAVSDADGEWFEVYNSSNSAIDMGGWLVSDGGSNAFTIQGTLVVPPRSFAVFCVNADSATNGGLLSPVLYDWGSSGTFTLGNTDDKIIIMDGDQRIDSIGYDGGTSWPDLTGASMALADFSTDNNSGGNWTAALSRQPNFSGSAGDLGSPGTLGENQSTGSGPMIVVSPESLHLVIGLDEMAKLPLRIGNTGSELLTWSLSISGDSSICPWLTLPVTEGEVAPGDTAAVKVRFSSAGLTAGSQTCTITIEANDEASPVTSIPVRLEVLDTALTGSISIPDQFLPVPVEGDSVEMDIEVVNETSVARETEMWVTMLRPGEPESRTVVDVKPLRLSPFETHARIRLLRIPPQSPPGAYALTLHLGRYPDSLLYSSTFLFEKEEEGGITRINPQSVGIPVRSFVDQSYPSPFNASTTILYGLSEDTWVTLKVFDLLGREIVTLVNEFQFAGYKTAFWGGRNNDGNLTSSGTYIYRIQAGDFSDTRTMVFMK